MVVVVRRRTSRTNMTSDLSRPTDDSIAPSTRKTELLSRKNRDRNDLHRRSGYIGLYRSAKPSVLHAFHRWFECFYNWSEFSYRCLSEKADFFSVIRNDSSRFSKNTKSSIYNIIHRRINEIILFRSQNYSYLIHLCNKIFGAFRSHR